MTVFTSKIKKANYYILYIPIASLLFVSSNSCVLATIHCKLVWAGNVFMYMLIKTA